jgi:predicted nuclease of restriction endonuclease-like (RecB) superfamily
VQAVSTQLVKEFGSGFSRANLFHMIKFSQVFDDFEIVSALSRQLSWTHFRKLIYIEDDLQREFYIQMCCLDKWSTRVLENRIDSMLFERTALSQKPDELITYEIEKLKEGVVSPNMILKDPYVLDFLELNDRYLEKDLEDAILRDIENFILELGNGFSFIARQKEFKSAKMIFILICFFIIEN